MTDFLEVPAGGDRSPRACSRTFELTGMGTVTLAGSSRRACVPQTAGGLDRRLPARLRVKSFTTCAVVDSILGRTLS
jgi:hypothetical protein